MPTPYPDGNFHTKNDIAFAADVDKATNGSLKIAVHSAGSLFKHPEIKRAVRQGTAPIGEILESLSSNEAAIYGLDSVPFLTTGYDSAKKLYDVSKPYLEKQLASEGLMLLYSVPWPPQGIYAKKEIKSVDDLKGMKFRTYNAMIGQIAELVGAIPTQIEVPDLPTAFATGRVDVMITSASTGVDTKAQDYLTHYMDTQAWQPRNIVFVNKAAFDKLTPAEQKGRTRRRQDGGSARLESLARGDGDQDQGVERRRHQGRHPEPDPKGRSRQGRRHHHRRVGKVRRRRWRSHPGGVQEVNLLHLSPLSFFSLPLWGRVGEGVAPGVQRMRRFLDKLYESALWASALCLVTIALLVGAQLAGRILDGTLALMHLPRTDFVILSLAEICGYLLAAASFLALAPTLKAGAHIRVTMALNGLSESFAAPPNCSPLVWPPSLPATLPGSSSNSLTSRSSSTKCLPVSCACNWVIRKASSRSAHSFYSSLCWTNW